MSPVFDCIIQVFPVLHPRINYSHGTLGLKLLELFSFSVNVTFLIFYAVVVYNK